MASEHGIDDKIRFLVLYLDANKKPSHISNISKILDRLERMIQDWNSKIEKGIDLQEIQKGRGLKPKVTKIEQKRVLRQTREKLLV